MKPTRLWEPNVTFTCRLLQDQLFSWFAEFDMQHHSFTYKIKQPSKCGLLTILTLLTTGKIEVTSGIRGHYSRTGDLLKRSWVTSNDILECMQEMNQLKSDLIFVVIIQ